MAKSPATKPITSLLSEIQANQLENSNEPLEKQALDALAISAQASIETTAADSVKEISMQTKAAAIQQPSYPTPRAALQRGFDALNKRNYAEAASIFATEVRPKPTPQEAESLAFWHARALALSGEKAEALQAFETFSRTFPESSMLGYAYAELGWILYDLCQVDRSKRYFESALQDASPDTKTRATRGLRAIHFLNYQSHCQPDAK